VVHGGHQKLSDVRKGIIRSAFLLPEGFEPARFIRNVVVFTLVIETIGAVLLFLADLALRVEPVEQRVHFALFQYMTAATTVGFNTYPIGVLGLSSVFLV